MRIHRSGGARARVRARPRCSQRPSLSPSPLIAPPSPPPPAPERASEGCVGALLFPAALPLPRLSNTFTIKGPVAGLEEVPPPPLQVQFLQAEARREEKLAELQHCKKLLGAKKSQFILSRAASEEPRPLPIGPVTRAPPPLVDGPGENQRFWSSVKFSSVVLQREIQNCGVFSQHPSRSNFRIWVTPSLTFTWSLCAPPMTRHPPPPTPPPLARQLHK